MPVSTEIVRVESGPDRLAAARTLFGEYASSLAAHAGSDAVLAAQGFARGVASVCLDTLPFMNHAVARYESLGFREVAPYRPTPMKGSRFFERVLGA